MRMAADLVHDLELDQDILFTDEPTEEQLDQMRTYLSYCYISSGYMKFPFLK